LLLASPDLAKRHLEVVLYVSVLDLKQLFEAFSEVASDNRFQNHPVIGDNN
jgi:hypothetical protein